MLSSSLPNPESDSENEMFILDAQLMTVADEIAGMALGLYFKTENNFIFGMYNFAHLSYYFPIGKVTHH